LLSNDVTAVHVSINTEDAIKVKRNGELYWMMQSECHIGLRTVSEYIEEIERRRQPDEIITIVVLSLYQDAGIIISPHPDGVWLGMALIAKKDIVITDVPYQVK
jgi:hypothetical protein